MEMKLTEEQIALMRIVVAEGRRAEMGQYADWAIKGDLMLERRKAFLEAAKMAEDEAEECRNFVTGCCRSTALGIADQLRTKAVEAMPGHPLPAKD